MDAAGEMSFQNMILTWAIPPDAKCNYLNQRSWPEVVPAGHADMKSLSLVSHSCNIAIATYAGNYQVVRTWRGFPLTEVALHGRILVMMMMMMMTCLASVLCVQLHLGVDTFATNAKVYWQSYMIANQILFGRVLEGSMIWACQRKTWASSLVECVIFAAGTYHHG